MAIEGCETVQEDAVAEFEGDKPDLTDEATAAEPLNRRLFFFKTVLGAATIATAASVVTSAPAEAQYLRRGTDNDPYDPRGGGRLRPVRRRVTDNDPYDAEGRGRGHRRVYRRRVTDNDPYDARGRGRGY